MAEKWHPDFERLVDEHQSMVFSLAWRMTGDRGLAEEVAQDVFLELDRHMERIENPEHAMFWLRRVAMNRSADALRRRKVRGVDLWVEIEENHGAPAEERTAFLNDLDREQKLYTAKKKNSDPVHYFRVMKELTILGYFSSEIGSTQALRFIEVPGSFNGSAPYKKGDRAWFS